MKRIALLSILLATTAAYAATTASTVTSNYITWTFDKEYPVGQFVTGDYYVIGPVKIVSITNSMSDESFRPADEDVHGSMVNPVVDNTSERFSYQWQGYDSRATIYKPELNASLPNGKPLSKDNPLALEPNQSLISMVSWLWRSPTEKEEGCPPVPGGPRPVTRPTIRAGAVLTCLDKAPPEGTFRPSYAGTEKRMFNVAQVKRDRLLALPPVDHVYAGSTDPEDVRKSDRFPDWSKEKNAPPATLPGQADELSLYWSYQYGADLALLTRGTARPWIDHIPDWYAGSHLKPSINISNYGREICNLLQTAMLALHLDWAKVEGAPKSKDTLANNMIQIGIDLAGCADAGSFWPANGGHHAGRKTAIMFAGLLLDDDHMKNVGHWTTRFQENENTVYVTEEMVEHTNSDAWRPETRGLHIAPYSKDMIGMPEWNGAGNAGWNTAYRDNNVSYYTGFALMAHMMDARKLWNHEPFFDYADRANSAIWEATKTLQQNLAPAFVRVMWDTYRDKYPSTYDKKWDDEKFIAWVTTPGFMLKSAPKAYGIFELKDDEPIRLYVGHDVDLSELSPKTVTVTSSEGSLTVAGIEASENPGAFFIIKFAEGTQLKPGIDYTVTVDQEVSDKWRNAIGMKPMTNKTTFKVR